MLGRRILTDGFWVQEKRDLLGMYFPLDQLRDIIETTLRFILTNPAEVQRIHERVITLHQGLFDIGKEIEKQNLRELSDRELIQLHDRLYTQMEQAHGTALATTWLVDSDGEDLSHALMAIVEKTVSKTSDSRDPSAVFSILTTPSRESLQAQEERESLDVAKAILFDSRACEIFSQESVAEIEKSLPQLDPLLHQKIQHHFLTWRWMPYTYIGPPYPLSTYLELWATMVREGINPAQENARRVQGIRRLVQERSTLFRELTFSDHEEQLFHCSAEIVWIKGFRKDALYYASFIVDQIFRELGRRVGFSMNQMRTLAPWEVATFNTFTSDMLNDRFRFSVVRLQKSAIDVLVGDEARAFVESQNIEKVDLGNITELKGTCACPGEVMGRVKIVNQPNDMHKMEKGDIMVTHTTYPALLPAMKKAAAIVTDDGGLTCHAAIVSRELQTPCVVGTRHATKILKDGDIVRVDAAKGIITKQ